MAAPFQGLENYSHKKSETDNEVLKTLHMLFGNILHIDVIKSVALNCKWNLQAASNILAELSSSVLNDQGFPQPKKKTSATNINSFGYAATNEDNGADVVIEAEFDNTNNTHIRSRSQHKQPLNKGCPNLPVRKKVISGRSTSVDNKKLSRPPVPVKPKQVQNKSKRELEFDRIREHILTGAKVLVLLRGLPGSGKSHLARILIGSTMEEDYRKFVFSTDDYFIINGKYNFNPTMVPEAHGWNQRRVQDVMMMGVSPIVIDNTNTQMWEMRPYIMFAIDFGYAVEILEPPTPWIYNPPELARRNCHNVPKAKIVEMLDRYDKKITPDKVFSTYDLKYYPSKHPPQPRLYPPLRRNIPSLFDIPVSIRRDNPADKHINAKPATIPKKKRSKKKKAEVQVEKLNLGKNSESFELIQSQSGPSVRTYEYSTSSESETESTPARTGETTPYNVPDLLSYDIIECREYVMVMPDNTRIYQKTHRDTDNTNEKEEYIDLINFNDCVDTKPAYSLDLISLSANKNVDKSTENHNINQVNAVTTDILCSASQQLASLNINQRKQDQEEEQETTDISTNPAGTYPKIDLSSWGLADDALISWEIMDKRQQKGTKYSSPQPQRELLKDLVTESVATSKCADAGTNTCSSDFNLIKRNYIDTAEGKIVATSNRNISEYCLISQPKPSVTTVFDKSTLTTNEDLVELGTSKMKFNSDGQQFTVLLNLFPHASRDDLREIYEKCQGDINWAVDLLLDSNLLVPSENTAPQNSNTDDTNIVKNQTIDHDRESHYQMQTGISEQNSAATFEEQLKIINVESKKSPNKFKSKTVQSEETLELKKQVEEHFKINDAHYSEHLLNLRRQKYGETDPIPSPSAITMNNDINQLALELAGAASTNADDIKSGSSSEEEIVEINVGMNFVEQLEKSIGVGNMDYPEGFQPVLQLPASLLKQLHAYWLESVYQQMEAQSNILETMVNEDEEFARRLQQQEEDGRQLEEPVVPDLQEIMDMEIALAIYRADQEQWKNETPDDLATRMKKQKLFETFPSLDPNTLTEILQAYNNSFDQTMEVLSASVANTQMLVDTTGAQGLEKQKELIENAKREYIQAKQSQNVSQNSATTVDEKDECSYAEASANDYREQAVHHLQMRHHCYSKAQAALQKKLTQVAAYYLDVAKLHKQKYEQANSLAASAFLSAHSYNHQNSNTLDLHYLYVKEAEQALAVFIDSQISKLKEIKKQNECIFIITGRGKRSRNGISHIKPAVKRKLDERKLVYVEMNPGLLKVNITKHSIMTNDLKG